MIILLNLDIQDLLDMSISSLQNQPSFQDPYSWKVIKTSASNFFFGLSVLPAPAGRSKIFSELYVIIILQKSIGLSQSMGNVSKAFHAEVPKVTKIIAPFTIDVIQT